MKVARAPRAGVVVNPVAGIGGTTGLNGSDGWDVQQLAAARGGVPRGNMRMAEALEVLAREAPDVELWSPSGEMGETAALKAGISAHCCYRPQVPSTASDTKEAVRRLMEAEVDLLLFAGGDGTARDVLDAAGPDAVVLGVPAGVKLHSGVFGISSWASGEAAARWLVAPGRLGVREAEVMDVDEPRTSKASLSARLYGFLRVPDLPDKVQVRKQGGGVPAQSAVAGGAALLRSFLASGETVVTGPGSTMAAIGKLLGAELPLVGVNVLAPGHPPRCRVDERLLLDVSAWSPVRIAVSPIGGQGFVLGRGNLEISPAVLRRVGAQNLVVICDEDKLAGLHGRPLRVDTGDPDLDLELAGYASVVTGERGRAIYPLRT